MFKMGQGEIAIFKLIMAVLLIIIGQVNKALFITNFVNMTYLLLSIIDILQRKQQLFPEIILQVVLSVHRQVTIILR